jgi:hypothetical protein
VTGPEATHEGGQADRRPEDAQHLDEGPALRDARTIAERVAADEAAADAVRQAFPTDGLPTLDEPLPEGEDLEPGERVYAIHQRALVEEHRQVAGRTALPTGGTLYVTSRRIIHRTMAPGGRIEIPLESITEMETSLERLVLIQLHDGSDLAVEVDQPRLLRVQLAAAIAAQRAVA